LAEEDAGLLATCDNYHRPRKKASYHLVILHGHLWGGRVRVAVIEERQVTGGNGRNPSGQEGWISSGFWIWELLGSVISFS